MINADPDLLKMLVRLGNLAERGHGTLQLTPKHAALIWSGLNYAVNQQDRITAQLERAHRFIHDRIPDFKDRENIIDVLINRIEELERRVM